MESFFLAETTKYLYLLFDPDNFLHNRGNKATKVETPGGVCWMEAGGYIYNTEAHPIDPAALQCCSGLTEKEIKQQISLEMVDILNPGKMKQFQGDLVPERIKMLEKKRQSELKLKKEREKQMKEQLELQAKQAQEAAAEIKRRDEEKRQMIQKAREAKHKNDTSTHNESVLAGDENIDDEDDTGDEDEEDENERSPEFSSAKESSEVTSNTDKSGAMITKLSRGEALAPSSGIVQPEKMVNVFEKKMNPVVEVISKIVNKIMPVDSQQFDLEIFTNKLQQDLQTRFKTDPIWNEDYFVMTCPAVKFTDRFLSYGEFFPSSEGK